MTTPYDRAMELTRPAGRRASGHFLAEGPHVVADALSAGAEVAAVFAAHEAEADDEIVGLVRRARDAGADVHLVPARALARLCDTQTPQGLVAVVAMPAPRAAPFADPGLWLLLDGVQDPGNVGTLLRSAEAFGATGVVAGPGTADVWSGKVLRAGQGAHFRLAILDGDVVPHLDALAAAGGLLWAATTGGTSIYRAPNLPDRVMLALGNEARGLSETVLARAALRVSVPQRGRAESVNVAMAGSILLSWMSERRG